MEALTIVQRHEEYMRFVSEMNRRSELSEPLIRLPWRRSLTAHYRTQDEWFQIWKDDSGKWHLQRKEGAGWADIGQKYRRRADVVADAEKSARREAGIDEYSVFKINLYPPKLAEEL